MLKHKQISCNIENISFNVGFFADFPMLLLIPVFVLFKLYPTYSFIMCFASIVIFCVSFLLIDFICEILIFSVKIPELYFRVSSLEKQ